MSASKTVVHLHNGILQSRKKERTPNLQDSIDGTGEYYANWDKPGGEKQLPYELTYKWNLITKQTSELNITRNIEIKNKLTLTSGEGNKGAKKGKGGQETCIKDPWTKKMVWGEDWMWEVVVGRARENNGGAGNEDNCNNIWIKS